MSDPTAGPDERGPRALVDRLRVDHRHPPATAGLVVAGAMALGWFAAWLTADLGVGAVAFVLAALSAGYGLYRQPDRTAVLSTWAYAVAALLALTPVFLNLPFLLAAPTYGIGDPAAFTLRLADAISLVAFLLLAAVPAAVGRWLSAR